MASYKLTLFAHDLRREATRDGNRLWCEFLSQYPVRFNRQKVVGSYILDFYCFSAKLAVELDGSEHFEVSALSRDDQRTQWVNDIGMRVLR